MTLRTRLSWIYALAVFVAVLLVVVVSIAAIDRTLRSSLDARLRTAAQAVAAIVDVHHGRIFIDNEDRAQFARILGTTMDGIIVDRNKVVLVSTASQTPTAITAVILSESRTGRFLTVGHGEHETRVAFEPIVHDGVVYGAVAAWRGSDWIDEFDRDAIIAMTAAACVAGLFALLLASTLVKRALAPAERMSALATEIEAHDLSRRLHAEGTDELSRLGAAFDRMLDRLEGAFARQRRFTADASHELRAPLAVIRAEADLALSKERDGSAYRAALETIASETARLDELVDGLLAAARADAGETHVERIDAGALVEALANRIAPHAARRAIVLDVQAEEAWLDADPRALERALLAVFHNAIDFAATHVTITCHPEPLTRHPEPVEGLRITITDDGPGFTPDALEHATERFWRGDAARPRGGTGLGLAIADAIVRAHGGMIVLANAAPHGAIVTLLFR